jgi:hypothetical protein
MDEGDRNFEREAALICRILVALKQLTGWSFEKPFNLDDCRDLLALCEVLPATEDQHILRMLGLIVNHTVALPGFHLDKKEFQFWSSLVRLLERSTKSTGDSSNVASVQRLRAILQQHWDLKNLVIQFTSNKPDPNTQ